MKSLKKDNRWFGYFSCIAILLLVAYFMDEFDDLTANTVIQAAMRGLRGVIHISLLMGWCISLYRRIMNGQVRRSLIAVAALMIFWLTAKVIKYEFIADRTFWLGRYIWYSYYIPMILIPLLGIFIIDHMGKPEGYRNPRWMYALYIPAFTILIGIFTNDLHQLAFSFPEGIQLFDYTYGYGPVYFAAMAWFVLGGIYVVVMLLKKSRVPGRKRIQKLPAMIMGGAVIFWTLYCLGIFRGCDLTVVDCLIISLLLESAIQSGLVASNTNYHKIFNASTVAAQIVDQNYQPCFVSSAATPLTSAEIKQAGEQPVKNGNSILHAKPIKAGYVLWQDDITEMNELMNRLQDAQKKLDRKNELLRAELKLKEQQAQIEEKSHLYDRITEEVAPQIEKLEALLEQISDPLPPLNAMAQMCVIGSYVKRRSNLLLLGEESPIVQAREIEYCLRESLDNLQLASVFVMLDAKCEGDIELKHIIAVYDFYESLVERLFDQITAVMVRIFCKNGTLKMNLQIGCINSIESSVIEDISLHIGSFTYNIQEEDVNIDIEISEGGVCK
ncbi:MAG: hypothetical protein E7246_00385 [Lachnoclostridium sp.]|nr:hypothetical protein [Lachnoclostridium sp.]